MLSVLQQTGCCLSQSILFAGSHVAFPSAQMFLWCPLWCRHPTAAVWTSMSTDGLWTWTTPSTNTTPSAHTPAPCWTLSSESAFNCKNWSISRSFRQWDWFQYIYKSFDHRGTVLDWNVRQSCTRHWDTTWSHSPGPLCPSATIVMLLRCIHREFHCILSLMTL